MRQTEAIEHLDLHTARGWDEYHDAALRQRHALPAIARLVPIAGGRGSSPSPLSIHGPRLFIGRHHPPHGPVDLSPRDWLDGELYKLGAPHCALELTDEGGWQITPLTPGAYTAIGDKVLMYLGQPHPVRHGELVTLGLMRHRFEVSLLSNEPWRIARRDLLARVHVPALWLKRSGAICGPHRRLPRGQDVLALGRSGRGETLPPSQSWDLSGLYEHERRHLCAWGPHVTIEQVEDEAMRWIITPRSVRQRTYVNRAEITEPRELRLGDELGLGNALFLLADLSQESASSQLSWPRLIDWRIGKRASPLAGESEHSQASEDAP